MTFPVLAGRLPDLARRERGRPAADAAVVRIGPAQDLLERQRRQPLAVPRAPLGGKQARERAAAGQAPRSAPQSVVDSPPGIRRVFWDRPRLGRWPATDAAVVRVRPIQNDAQTERRRWCAAPLTDEPLPRHGADCKALSRRLEQARAAPRLPAGLRRRSSTVLIVIK